MEIKCGQKGCSANWQFDKTFSTKFKKLIKKMQKSISPSDWTSKSWTRGENVSHNSTFGNEFE